MVYNFIFLTIIFSVLEPIPAAPAADDTEYVADKMAELVVAVENQGILGIDYLIG